MVLFIQERRQEVVVYLDNDLKNEEEKDYLSRVDSNMEDYSKEKFLEKQYDFGTIVLCTNLEDTPDELYSLYKSRCDIEQNFDFLKNLLEVDTLYLQDKYAVEAWAFINHISLMLVHILYNRLRVKKKLSAYSVSDFIFHLKYIHKIKITTPGSPLKYQVKLRNCWLIWICLLLASLKVKV